MSQFGYRKELEKYEDIDEDEILASLTSDELNELERELDNIDPNQYVPIGLRQKDQTDKTPQGTFSREALMAYWEHETQKLLENERLCAEPGQVSCKPKLLQYFVFGLRSQHVQNLVSPMHSFMPKCKHPF